MLKIGTKVKIVCTEEKLISHSNAKTNNGKEGILINNDLPIFKVKIDGNNINIWADCIQEADTYILPEKWYIKREKYNHTIINQYFNKISNSKDYMYENLSYFHFPSFDIYRDYYQSNEIESGYTEITFDQFKKYVLKQDLTINKLEDKSLKLEEIKSKLIKVKYDKEDIKDIIECLSL